MVVNNPNQALGNLRGATPLLNTPAVNPDFGESKRGEALMGNPPESPFAKGGGLLPFSKGEQEGFKQGGGDKGREVNKYSFLTSRHIFLEKNFIGKRKELSGKDFITSKPAFLASLSSSG